MFQEFRLNLGKSSKMIIFTPLWATFNVSNNFGAAIRLPKISLSRKPNHRNQVKSAQIPDVE